ncbi:MAG: NAD(P)-dependent alcohol dehydrogenase [Spongiibacteraceae bacterium]
MIDSQGYAALIPKGQLQPFSFQRRQPAANDIQIDILYCGICHSDLHSVDNDMGNSLYPIVPGHEIIGRVVAVGESVRNFKIGDMAGIGCIVDSCRHCPSCETSRQQFCVEGFTSTFNARERISGAPTLGGYSTNYVVDENYALHIPANLNTAAAAPLLCAGITTYAPLKRYGTGPGKRVGVLGLGGLGHLAIKMARAMGATPVIITTSPDKTADAARLGAEAFILSGDTTQMAQHVGTLDLILDTVSGPHDPNAYLQLLKLEGVMCLIGVPTQPLPVSSLSLVFGQKSLTGSFIGGVAETQEMLEFCSQHDITADIELIRIQDVNIAYERMQRNDVKYRFVIDMESMRSGPAE